MIPDEDKALHEHDYIDFYTGWGYVDTELTKMFLWVFCKKCLDKKKLYIDMSEAIRDDEDEY